MSTPFHILHADDDAEDRSLFRDAVAEFDIDIQLSQVENGVEVLLFLEKALLINNLPCSIVCDMSMPAMNGTELLEQLKQHPQLKHIPVIMFSTSSSIFDHEQTKALGAKAFFSKPDTWAAFLKTIHAVLSICTESTPTLRQKLK